MIRNLIFLVAFIGPSSVIGQETPKSVEQFVAEVNEKIPQLLADFAVPGTAIAIIDDGEVILQQGYGFADLAKEIKVTPKTGFNIGSVSKTVAAWGIMKLVEEGKLDLDAPAESYLTRWQLPESEFSADEVTFRRLLSHTAGLSLHGYPGWSPSDTLPTIEESLNGKNNGPGRVEIIMEPGSQYKYSGGGYTMMQLIIEEVTGQRFEEYIQAQILDPLGMTSSSYKIDNKIMAASASEYDKFGDPIGFELFTAQAAAGFHTTIEDFTRFAFANLHRIEDFKKYNPVLPAAQIEQMMVPVPQATGRYGYGLGYMIESIPGTSVLLGGHRGANSGWHAIFNVNPETNDGFIMLTNGGSGHHVYSAIFYDWVLWKLGVKLEDWHNAKPSIANKLKAIVDSKGIDDLSGIYTELKNSHLEKYDFSESQLNLFGYHYLGKKEYEKAIAVFKLNVDEFPKSFNVYDSYGEALLANGDRDAAIDNYRKSIKLNPANENGIKVLNDLGISTDDLMVSVSKEQLELLAGEYIMTYSAGWSLVFEIESEEFICYDGNYRFRLLPTADNAFVNADDGVPLEFDTRDPEAITLLMRHTHKFWKKGASKPPIARKLYKIIDSTGIEDISTIYWNLKQKRPDDYDFSEGQLNSLGYHYLADEDLEKAIAILKLNVEAFPDAFNVYDSYGEALLKLGVKDEGIENYLKSVKLNPGNEHGIQVLNNLGVSTEDLRVKVSSEKLKQLAGEYIMNDEAEWKLVMRIENEALVGYDGDYQFRLLPTGDNKFIIPNMGPTIIFDPNAINATTLVLDGKYEFRKVK